MLRTGSTLLVALSLAATPAAPILAQPVEQTPSPDRRITLTLDESLRAALLRSPEVRRAEAEVEGIRGKQLQAHGARLPQLEMTTVLGPSPRARGDQILSPDRQFSPRFTGAFVRTDFQIIQPIFTWGLLENARLAAEHGVLATQAGVDLKSSEVALEVKRAYWGMVVSKSIRDFLLDIRTQVDAAAQRAERLIEGGFTTEADVYRLRANKGELEENLNLVEKTLDLARAALAAWTGQPSGSIVGPADTALPDEIQEPGSVEEFIEDARAGRPEFLALHEGIEARRNLVEVDRKARYPLFFVGVFGSAATSTNRDRLDNPFVVDPLNHFALGPLVGFRYDLDFGTTAGKVKEAEAEVGKLEALRDFARDGVPLQVRQAHASVLEAMRNVRAFEEARQNAKKWLVSASSNFDIGVGEPRELADAVVAYAKTQGEYLQALYAYVIGLEQLRHAAGLDIDEVRRLETPAPATAAPGAPSS